MSRMVLRSSFESKMFGHVRQASVSHSSGMIDVTTYGSPAAQFARGLETCTIDLSCLYPLPQLIQVGSIFDLDEVIPLNTAQALHVTGQFMLSSETSAAATDVPRVATTLSLRACGPFNVAVVDALAARIRARVSEIRDAQ